MLGRVEEGGAGVLVLGVGVVAVAVESLDLVVAQGRVLEHLAVGEVLGALADGELAGRAAERGLVEAGPGGVVHVPQHSRLLQFLARCRGERVPLCQART